MAFKSLKELMLLGLEFEILKDGFQDVTQIYWDEDCILVWLPSFSGGN